MTAGIPDHVIEPSGPGEDLLEGSPAFYLTYQSQIESWERLRPNTRQQIANWHRRIVARAVDVDGWVRAEPDEYVMFGLAGKAHDLTIGLMWDGNPAKPYTIVHPTTTEAPARFLSMVAPEDLQGYQSSASYPAWRYIELGTPGAPWWADLDQCRETLVEAIKEAITRFGETVAAAVEGAEP